MYLSSGFLDLRTQRFAEAYNPEQWLELFVYNMGNEQNAFSVYSTQRRADAEAAGFSQSAYRRQKTLCFSNKVSFTSKSSVPPANCWIECLPSAENFSRKHPAGSERINELALFPETSLVPGSIALLAENAFGFIV